MTYRDRNDADRRTGEQPYGIDRRGSGQRNELRFLIAPDLAHRIEVTARAWLKFGDTEADAPWYTTTYCDTAAHELYRAAAAGETVLLRFREYHSRRPERALASYRVWIEWKEETAARSAKRRFVVRGRDVTPFLRGELEGVVDDVLGARGPELVAAGLRPSVVTQCRRVVYASRRDQLRVTFDHELTYLALEHSGSVAETPYALGAVIAREAGIVVELKWQGTPPPWTASIFETLREQAADRPGKFVVATGHLLGEEGVGEL